MNLEPQKLHNLSHTHNRELIASPFPFPIPSKDGVSACILKHNSVACHIHSFFQRFCKQFHQLLHCLGGGSSL